MPCSVRVVGIRFRNVILRNKNNFAEGYKYVQKTSCAASNQGAQFCAKCGASVIRVQDNALGKILSNDRWCLD